MALACAVTITKRKLKLCYSSLKSLKTLLKIAYLCVLSVFVVIFSLKVADAPNTLNQIGQ